MKLQHQYEVFTHLAEIQTVIYVAEELPAKIDEEWIRRHDWILANVLKDESHRQTLNDLIQDVDQKENLDTAGKFGLMVDKAKDMFATFEPHANRDVGGLSIPDIYSEPQRIYLEEVRASEDRRRANLIRTIKRNRLYQHIQDNILYYCQAIWRREGSDQRLLRYKKEGRRLPIEWQGPFASTLQHVGAPAQALNLADFTPTGREAEIWEIINPAGPIAFIGNYAVFNMKPLPDHYRVSMADASSQDELHELVYRRGELFIGINEVLAQMSAPYISPQTGTLLDPARAFFVRQAAKQNPQDLRQLTDEEVYDFLSYLPKLESTLLDQNGDIVRARGQLNYQITHAEWGEYLYRKNNTRRFLVDSNNLYLNIRVSSGAALEPFKRVHRYLDVLRAAEQLNSDRLKNVRRAMLVNSERAFDPDIEKVVILEDRVDSANSIAAITEALDRNAASAEGGSTPDETLINQPE